MPSAEDLFRDYFLPLYPDRDAAAIERARRDDANPANNPALYAVMGEVADAFASTFPEAAGAPNLTLDRTDRSVHEIGALLTRDRRDVWLASGAAGTESNALFNVVAHGVAYVGECVVREHNGQVRLRNPLWESRVALTSHAGIAELPLLSWWLRSLADDAFDAEGNPVLGLAERYRTHVEVPTFDASRLPVWGDATKTMPRLAKVRYDALYKYLKAHVPGFRDLGVDFPSAERFDAYQFKWLSAAWVGGGRMLVLYGLGEGGFSLFWLTESGFAKTVFIPCDSFPDPLLRVVEEKIEIRVAMAGREVVQEMLWWGV